ncbi:MAG: hypothetical protein ABIQ02_16705 [Saprospiraceae bacterium]
MLLTNVGIPVFTHVCHGQGMSWSSIVPVKGCCSKKQVKETVIACHTEFHTQVETVSKKPCCENQTEFMKMKSDFMQAISGFLEETFKVSAAGIITIDTFSGFFSLSVERLPFQAHAPPVSLSGRSLLLFKQVLRI